MEGQVPGPGSRARRDLVRLGRRQATLVCYQDTATARINDRAARLRAGLLRLVRARFAWHASNCCWSLSQPSGMIG